MPRTTVEEGYAFAERLRKLIMEKRFPVDSAAIQITISIGVSSMRDRNGHTLEDYYLPADKALYQAKQGGKNRVERAGERTGV